jgi:hypothetical protein
MVGPWLEEKVRKSVGEIHGGALERCVCLFVGGVERVDFRIRKNRAAQALRVVMMIVD